VTTGDWSVIGVAIFFMGVFVGKTVEAYLWRATANDYLRRASGGKLYVVRVDPASDVWNGRTSR
jgi:hypothetical protein